MWFVVVLLKGKWGVLNYWVWGNGMDDGRGMVVVGDGDFFISHGERGEKMERTSSAQ